MVRQMMFCVSLLMAVNCLGQTTNKARQGYEQFKKQARQEYVDFRRACNDDYAAFLKQAWLSYEAGPVVPRPKEREVKPVVMPQGDVDKPVKPMPVKVDTVIAPVPQGAQPNPVAPIYEGTVENEQQLSFTFFGTEGRVRMPALRPDIGAVLKGGVSENEVSKGWTMLSEGGFDHLIRDCLGLRMRHQLCDWAYLLMLRKMSESYYGGDANASTLFLAWVYCQSGYQMRLGSNGQRLYLLFGSRHQIYDHAFFRIDGNYFYPLVDKGETASTRLRICGAAFPEEQPLSLYIPSAMSLANNFSDNRTIRSKRYPSVEAQVRVNRNLIDFYDVYPTSAIDDNPLTRWAMYANTPMAENVKSQLYGKMRQLISGKSQIEAANMLIDWVQTGLVYEYDDKVWDGDRAFFAEETLYYPYCDCEDRAILFTRMVRDLLGLKCILVYYPNHLACAVGFDQAVQGDYVVVGGRRFVIADPTYIGAPVGRTMPDMDNSSAQVIMLE